jgi:hypothetical protein
LTSSVTGGQGNYQYQWQDLEGETWMNIQGATNPTYQPQALTSTKQYRLMLTDFCGVITSNVVTITISPLPTSNAGANAVICVTDSYQLQGSATNYSSVMWTTAGDGTFDDPSLLDATYYPGPDDITAGAVTLTLTAYAIEPCTDPAYDVMTIEFTPLPLVFAGDDATICENESFMTMGYTNNAWTTLWTTQGDGTFDNPSSMAAIYYPGPGDLAEGSVVLVLTATSIPPCDVSVSDAMVLSFEYLPSANAGANATICANQTYTLDGSASDYASITWTTSGDGTFNNTHILDATYTPGTNDKQNGSVVLTLTATSIAPCSGNASDNMTLTITAQPTANAGPDATQCGGGNFVLSGASAAHYASVLWTTSGTGTFVNPAVVNATYQPSAADIIYGTVTLTLTAQAMAPCSAPATDHMTLTIVMEPTANAGPDAATCGNTPYQLNGDATNYASVKWTTSGDGLFDNPNILNAVYTPGSNDITSGSVTLTLTAYANAPCPQNAVDHLVLTVAALPTVNAGEDAKICQSDHYMLQGQATNYSLTIWTSSGDGTFDNNTLLNATYYPGPTDIIQGIVSLTLTAYPIEPCTGEVTDAMTLSIDRIPDSPGTPVGPDTACVLPQPIPSEYITSGSPNALSYTWDIFPTNAGTITGVGASVTVYWSGDYIGPVFIKVAGVNDCGMGSFSDIKIVDAEVCPGIPDNPSNVVSIKVFPNPSDGKFTLAIDGVKGNLELSIMDYAGQSLTQERIHSDTGQYTKVFDLSSYPKGVYFLKITGEGIMKVQKIVIR